MIGLENLTYQYNVKSPMILKGIDLQIARGEFVALVGQNGAGKTTLLRLLNGLQKPTDGRVLVNGKDTRETKTSEMAQTIGYLFQNPNHQIFCKTVYDEIAFGLKERKKEKSGIRQMDKKIQEIAELLGLQEILQTSPFHLSKGEKQRVALASILALETDILVLDEPTTGQDYKECMEIMAVVKKLNEEGTTVIMVSHDMEVVLDFAKRVVILHNGKVLEDGRTSSVLFKKESLEVAGLKPPQLFEVMLRLGDDFSGATTAEEICQVIKRRRGNETDTAVY
ncbi:energy-coupling factor ABC transporter ATP-binding protein [Sporanaerobium hydrogeniformans]|uniref:Energy-coupling factor ABC transporter ATP-binding protein n=1 Tax=Sporanaerobium hydrogeniformans TaxID=3072179 RepID=A0AC61D646_9FIRM|nr:ABC transporter ATP-binding protein [Sporanaerobium hydrogeniformans]PHV69194.1 energy-coupling factor ABC transporter ATP-binding protein [Sporanaerobium hydrogeniformans]